MKPIILKNHHNNLDTIIWKNFILSGSKFLSMRDIDNTKNALIKDGLLEKQWQEILDAIEKGEGNSDTSESVAEFALLYCEKVENDPEMRQIITDSGDPKWAYHYCLRVSEDDDMRQIIIDSGEPQWAYEYCLRLSEDDDMRQIVMDGGREWAFDYCMNIGEDKEMRNAAIYGF